MHNRHRKIKEKTGGLVQCGNEQHSANRAEKKNVLSLKLMCRKSPHTRCFSWFIWTMGDSELQRVLIAHCSIKQPHTILFHPAQMITDGFEWRFSNLFMLAAADNRIKCVKLLSGPSTPLEHRDKHLSLFAAWKLPPEHSWLECNCSHADLVALRSTPLSLSQKAWKLMTRFSNLYPGILCASDQHLAH